MSERFGVIKELKESLNQLSFLNGNQPPRYYNTSSSDISDKIVQKLGFFGIFFLLGTIIGLMVGLIAKYKNKG